MAEHRPASGLKAHRLPQRLRKALEGHQAQLEHLEQLAGATYAQAAAQAPQAAAQAPQAGQQ